MGRHQELRLAGAGQVIHQRQQRELPLRREGRFWLVEDEQSSGETVLHDGQKCLAVRHPVQRTPAVDLIWIRSNIFAQEKVRIRLACVEQRSKLRLQFGTEEVS